MKDDTLNPDQYCQERAAKSGSSFYYSFMFLPPLKRRAITALYAFCREVDDVADECLDVSIARTKLAWWRNEVSNIYAGGAEHPVGQALTPLVKEFGLPATEFDEIISGMEMDLTQNRYADFDQLQLYCHRVAGVVGLLSARIFGYQDARTETYAHDLGLAFQLTNIIRDVGEDARRNRIYLPLDELAQFDVKEADILHGRESENFSKLMAFQDQRANRYYTKAFAALPAIDRKNQRTGLIMAAIYHAVLDEVRLDGYHVLNQRISLTPLRKLWIAFKTWLRE